MRTEIEADRGSARPFVIGWAVFLLFMLTLGWFTPQASSRAFDFRQFYGAGYMVRTEPAALYDLHRQQQVQDSLVSPLPLPLPYVHPSFEALVFAPLSLLPYRAAYLAFVICNVLLLAAVFFSARQTFNNVPGLQPRPGLLFFLFVPVIIAVWQGQDSLLFLLLCSLAWTQLRHGRDALAGCLIALCLFRFQLAIPLAVLIGIHRGRKFSAAFLITVVALVLLSIGITGPKGAADMMRLLAGVSLSGDQSSAAQTAMAMHPLAMPNLFGLLYACGTRFLGAHVAFAIQAAASLAVFAWCGWRMRREPEAETAFALALICSVLVSQHLYAHDASLLLLAFALLSTRAPTPLLMVCYYAPIALLLFLGPSSFFLLAAPLLALLFFGASSTSPRLRATAGAV